MNTTTSKRGNGSKNEDPTSPEPEIKKTAEGQSKRENFVVSEKLQQQHSALEVQASTDTFDSSSVPHVEDLLRAAKEATRGQSTTPQQFEKETPTENTADTVANQLATVLGQSATELMETATVAQQAIVAMMLTEGLNDAVEASSAYQAGLLLGLTQVKAKNINDLVEQVSVLRSHVNKSNAGIVGQTLKALAIGQQKEQVKLPLLAARETPRLKII